MEEDAEAETLLHPYELQFSDLLLLSSDEPLSSSSDAEEIQRLELITSCIMENLGPNGPGLVAITGVPGRSSLRSSLLRFAPKLALLDFRDLNRLLKENGLGSDVPLKNLDRTVSPFTMNLKYGQSVLASSGKAYQSGIKDCMVTDRREESLASDIKILRNIFEVLGSLMIELGCRLARVCDRVIGGQDLEQSLFEAGTANGRLIHYHSGFDNLFLQASSKRKESITKGHAGVNSGIMIMVGESADILSKGRLRATLHSVSRPSRPKDLSRENFVVFLHPAWSKTFSLLNYPVDCWSSGDQQLNGCTSESSTKLESEKLPQEIYKIVPPLSTRLKEGMTFAEFSKETTKQYYGGSGLQSKR
ncbi:hypothetical protein POM88_050333 [Heracleum sosnowskyi]|uniref:Isopenicillin N synthase-like Fe(2+) 2OG dioxygenase domain-containing protein n=1 Tax=Heracleum sosnowskyi TaxID=360622 RepID=A0AAD8M2G4_9APIA|nr:hypothetical protein POM88_050333 [Heracleum sosnowskyi]